MISASSEDDEPVFDFDQEFDRREVPALKYHRMVLGNTCTNTTNKQAKDVLFVAGVADMDFAVAPCIQRALQERLKHPLLGYEAVPDGLYPALCDWMHKRHGWKVQQDHILRAPNVLNSLAMAMCSVTEPGDAVIVQPPVFFDFYDIIAENKRTLVENPLQYSSGRYTMDLEHLASIAAQAHAKILFLCNPHNPIGRVWSKEELSQLAQVCKDHKILIVADEIHGDLCFDDKFTPMASISPSNSIALTSPAKTFNIASCCSAFTIISNPDLRAKMKAENSRLTVSKNNAFASVAMEAAYREGGSWLDAVLHYMRGNMDLLKAGLPKDKISLVEPQGTFLMWLDCQNLGIVDEDGQSLKHWFRTHAGWAVTRGAAFGRQGHGFVRVNIACPRRQLEEALIRLRDAVSELDPSTQPHG